MTLELPSGLIEPEPRQPGRWEAFAVLVTALATLAVALAGAKPYVQALLAAATVSIAAGQWYSPLRTRLRGQGLRARRTRVARKVWPEFLRLEKRFSEFLSDRDSRNLRYIINDIGGNNDEELFQVCPPDYLNVFYPILSSRHSQTKTVREANFRIAENELVSMVNAYNNDYVLRSLQRLKNSSRFTGLEPSIRKYREGAIEAFRERWVSFLDTLTEFVAARNDDLEYEPYHEAIHASFERPKKLT